MGLLLYMSLSRIPLELVTLIYIRNVDTLDLVLHRDTKYSGLTYLK